VTTVRQARAQGALFIAMMALVGVGVFGAQAIFGGGETDPPAPKTSSSPTPTVEPTLSDAG
jgi:hypothetical protein